MTNYLSRGTYTSKFAPDSILYISSTIDLGDYIKIKAQVLMLDGTPFYGEHRPRWYTVKKSTIKDKNWTKIS